MKGTIEYLGRGLLVLALSGWAIGCGDDDSAAVDGGTDSGAGGSGGTSGGSGGGGAKDSGTGGMGTGGSGSTVTVAECVSMTDTATGGMTTAECAMCVCEADVDASVACAKLPGTTGCWALISCFGAKCGNVDPMDMAATTMCALSNCGDSIGSASAATPLGAVIRMSCSTKCVSMSGTDGGGDGG